MQQKNNGLGECSSGPLNLNILRFLNNLLKVSYINLIKPKKI